MASADGTVYIDVDIPVNKVRTDSQEIKSILDALGDHAGDKLDSHFKQNTEKAKNTADSASRDINSKLGKDIKAKFTLNDNEAADKVNKIKDKIKGIPKQQKTDISASDHSSGILSRIKDRLMGVNKEGKETQHTFKSIAIGSAIGNLASNAFSSAVSGMKRVITEGMQLNAVTGSIRAQFKAMGLSDRYTNRLIKQIGFLKSRINATGVDISSVQKNMMNWSVIGRRGAYQMTTALGAMAASGRLNGDQLRMMSMQMMRVGSSGKVTLSTLSRIAKSVPNFYAQLARGAGMSEAHLKSLLASGKVTQKQFQGWIAASAKYAGSAFKDYGKTQAGALAQMKGAWQTLEAQMTQPLFNMKTSAMQELASIMKSKPVQDGAKLIGDGLRRIAFYGMEVLRYLGTHKRDITGVLEDTVKIAGTLAKDVWKDFADIVVDIGKDLGIVNRNGKRSGDSLHSFRLAMDDIAKNKGALQTIAHVLVGIAAIRGLGKIAGFLREIGGVKVGKNSVIESLQNSGGWSSLIKSPKNGGISTGGKLAIGATAIFSGYQIYGDFNKAVHDSSVHQKWKDAGSGIGGFLGAVIGLYFGGWQGMLLGEQIGKRLGKYAGKSFEKYFNPKTKKAKPPYKPTGNELSKTVHDQYGNTLPVVGYDENGVIYRGNDGKLHHFDQRNSMEKQFNTGHRLYSRDFFQAKNPGQALGGLASMMWQLGTHIGDTSYLTRSGDDVRQDISKGWWHDFFMKPMGQQNPNMFKGWDSATGRIGNWWSGQVRSLQKQFAPLSHAKIDWGFLDPKQNGLSKFLAGFKPQIHGKAPSLKNMKIQADSFLPNLHPIQWIEKQFKGFKWPKLPKWNFKLPEIHPIKWIESKFKGFHFPKLPKWHFKLPEIHPIKWIKSKFKGWHWPKLPKFRIHFPNIHPIRWLKSKFKGWHLPKLKIHKPSMRGFNRFIGTLKRNTRNGFNTAKRYARGGIRGILGHINTLRRKGSSTLGRFSSYIGKNWKGIKSKGSSIWRSVKNSVIRNAERARKQGSNKFRSLQTSMSNTGKNISKAWHNLWNGIASFFSSIWKSIKKTASGGINAIIGVINGGISGIDNVIHSFGGKAHAISLIPKVKLATGTWGRNPITRPTLAILNDGHDSPETDNKETIWNRNTGTFGVVHGTNVPVLLDKGMEVFSASQSRDLGFTHFAKGTNPLAELGKFVGGLGSWIGQKGKQLKKWFDLAMKIVSHPLQALDNLMKPSEKGLNGIFVQLGKGMFNHAKDAAKSWWSTLWSMASGDLNGDGGPAKGLLKAVEKYGEGHRYVWATAGPKTFDCSGLVMYALKHAYGINFPHYSGAQYALTEHIPKSKARMGDLVFWGSGGSDHVGVYAGGNKYFSAQSPSQGIHMNTLDSVVGKGKPLFGRVRGLSQDSSKKDDVKAKNGFEKSIKDRVGNGFFHFMKRLGDLFGVTGSFGNPAGDGVMRWKGLVKKALRANGFSASPYQVNAWLRVIARESGGNPHAINNWDSNAAKGTPSKGLVQTIEPTFIANAFKGHHNIWNGYDDLLAGIRYMARKYGRGPSAFARVSGSEGYAWGGIVKKPTFALIGEDGIERIINVKKPTADSLIDNTIQARAQVAPESPSGKLAKLINLDQVRYSAANGYKPEQQGKSPTVVRTIVNNNGQQMPKGNVRINVNVGSARLASVLYPKIKILQGHDLDIVSAGGAIGE